MIPSSACQQCRHDINRPGQPEAGPVVMGRYTTQWDTTCRRNAVWMLSLHYSARIERINWLSIAQGWPGQPSNEKPSMVIVSSGLSRCSKPIIGNHARAGHRGMAHAQLSELQFQPQG